MPKPLKQLIDEKFGIKTQPRVNSLTNSVGTTVTQILGNNPNRVSWLIVNLAAQGIYIGFDRTVSSTKGVYLPPNGGSASMVFDEDFHTVSYEVFGISTAVSPVYVLEIIIVE